MKLFTKVCVDMAQRPQVAYSTQNKIVTTLKQKIKSYKYM